MKDKDTLLYIEKLRTFGQNYGLFRTKRLLELLGSPEKDVKLIHVAGTNGKGSTSVMLGKVLEEHGYNVGYFNSPHLIDIEESIRINNENIKEEELIELFKEIKPLVDKVIEEGLNHPTEFEVLTCLMFKYLSNKKVDFGVIEVGLGGRLDSTNVITPIISLITQISLDHTNILGNTLSEIAKEKAGIIKKKISVVSAIQEEEALREIKDKTKEEASNLVILEEKDFRLLEVIKGDKVYQKVEIKDELKELELDLPLLGEHQIMNLALAIKALKVLEKEGYFKLDDKKIYEGVKNVKWMGRTEVLKNKPTILIDGAHNFRGIEALKNTIEKYFNYNNLYLVLGILKDKEVEKMIKVIVPMATKVFTLKPNSPRGMEGKELRDIVYQYNKEVKYIGSYEETIKEVLSLAKEGDLVVFAGSLYMIGEVRSLILEYNSEF